ncbi:F0F1 ATP synthase subunit epsilon [Tsukamurella sp. 8F]|uniref:F0F1 ATP synthase subunit epsilon n=1 Tax=unclassified Tsukamurella TaxID=2633480 RepID=UPI0023B8DC92|nr:MULTISPECIES: F0F1 ATP synthase subunit epsilon [unclassified Tsukamurella]MDF0530292.1 F0F1 ATP synthase subunit epsilon [Tsukamurella sp. 8J]MDF0587589.1 F0F1 ATP synthase subunit epsilon [Tsukamurella sp. 8F]
MADGSFQVEIVSVEERLYSGEATFVIAQTTEGELGVLAQHEPLFGQLIDGGAVAIDPVQGDRVAAAIHGGFLSVTGEKVTVLADAAEWATSLNEADVKRDLEAAADGSDEQATAQGRLRALEYLAHK